VPVVELAPIFVLSLLFLQQIERRGVIVIVDVELMH
jgi:hypothetical protein